MKKILVPYDFTETSQSALNYGIEVAKYLSADLVLAARRELVHRRRGF